MKKLRGLYAITSQNVCASESRLLGAVGAALDGGAALIQYRDKWNSPERREIWAHNLLQLCRARGAPLIINDDVALAGRIGADGVHLGSSDVSLARARADLGAQAIIGITCSNSIARALAADVGGADYIALGRFFASHTKPDAPQASLELLNRVRAQLPYLPICVIGGITPENAPPLLAAGADLLAAVEGIFGAEDIRAAAQGYQACF